MKPLKLAQFRNICEIQSNIDTKTLVKEANDPFQYSILNDVSWLNSVTFLMKLQELLYLFSFFLLKLQQILNSDFLRTNTINSEIFHFFYNQIRKNMNFKFLKNFKQLHELLPKHNRVYDAFSHRMPHNAYPQEQTQKIQYTHIQPEGIKDTIACYGIKFIRKSYDFLTKYDPQNMTEAKWVKRCMFLETVAGVPGMVGGMCRHLRGLRTMKRDNGWIHHLIEEADNERFHLIIFLNLRKPSFLQRTMIIGLQGIFMNTFFVAYLLNPKFCHRFVGYLQEEAVKTYTIMLNHIEDPNGVLHHWNKVPAPKDAIEYYHLEKEATYHDVILSIRADEACHRETNHFFAEINPDFDISEEKTTVYNESILKEKNKEQKQK